MAELIKENAGVEMHPSMPIDEARKIADDLEVAYLDVWGSGKIMTEVYDATCEAKLIEPTFVMDHPREVSPLARAHRDDPELTERFELVVAARELANAYSELNDPVDQRAALRGRGASCRPAATRRPSPVDEDYIRALEYGLPPTGGLGVGIDRLVMLISGAESIREVILFPTMRPVEDGARDGARRPTCRRRPRRSSRTATAQLRATAGHAGRPSQRSPRPPDRGPPRVACPARLLAWLTARSA